MFNVLTVTSIPITPPLEIDYGQPWRRTYGDNITYTDWQRDNYFKALQMLAGESKNIGIEYDHVNLQNLAKLQNAFPKANLIDVGEPTMRMRMKKSKEEQAVIRNGARIADIGGEALVKAIRVGIPEHEVAMTSTQAMIREIARTYPGADMMDSEFLPFYLPILVT